MQSEEVIRKRFNKLVELFNDEAKEDMEQKYPYTLREIEILREILEEHECVCKICGEEMERDC